MSESNESSAQTKSDINIKDFFTKFNDISSRCKICCNILKHHNNTTNLRNHLKRKHSEYINSPDKKSQKKLCVVPTTPTSSKSDNTVDESDETETRSTTSTITLCSSTSSVSTMSTKLRRIDQAFKEIDSFSEYGTGTSGSEYSGKGKMYAKITNALLFMIATDNLPLWTTEQNGFLFFMKTAVPHYKVPGRTTITKLLDEKYCVLSNKIKEQFFSIEHFTITTDIWTDTLNTKGFLGVTVHFLGLDFKMKSIALGAFALEQSHTSVYISRMLNEILAEWHITPEKITVIVTDNGANMVKAIQDSFGVRKHLPCFAHIINLIVTNSIKAIPQLKDIISKIKGIVTFFKQSVTASDALRKQQLQNGKNEGSLLKLLQECETRWNSTFYMVERFLQLAPLISTILFQLPKPAMISHEEMNVMKDVVSTLAPFEKVTVEMSAENHVVCSKVIPITHCLKLTIDKQKSETKIGGDFRDKLLKEINRRFYSEESKIENNKILSIATVLDPRFKRLHFESPIAVANTLASINNLIKQKYENSNDASNVSLPLEPTPLTEKNTDESDIWSVHDNCLQADVNQNNFGTTGGLYNELKQYLDQPLINRSQDPIQHWNNLKTLFPALYEIALKYLSVVSTSVPSERLFSKAGNIINEKRNRLTGKRLSKLIFLSSLNKDQWYLEN